MALKPWLFLVLLSFLWSGSALAADPSAHSAVATLVGTSDQSLSSPAERSPAPTAYPWEQKPTDLTTCYPEPFCAVHEDCAEVCGGFIPCCLPIRCPNLILACICKDPAVTNHC